MPEADGYVARLIAPQDRPAWDRMFAQHAMSRSIVPKWDELSGWTMFDVGLFRGPEVIGGMKLSVRRIPMLPFSLSRINALMIGPERHAEMLEVLLAELERVSLKKLIVETEVRVRIPADDALPGFEYHRDVARLFNDFGYRALSKVDSTYVVSIDRDDEALFRAFEDKARNKIRRAQKQGVLISTSNDPSLMNSFYGEYLSMTSRKKAPVTPKKLVVDGLEPLVEKKDAELFTESYGGVVSNIALVDTRGMPCYSLGTRTAANVKREVAGAAQVMHFEIMKRLRDRGKKFYDLGGCEGPVPDETHPNYGVWRFKYGFGGIFVRFLPYYRKTRGPTREVLDAVHKIRGDYL